MKAKIQKYALFLSLLWIGVYFPPPPAACMSIDEAIKRMSDSYSRLSDYRCILNKQELIRGAIREQKNIISKFKKPLCCYMKWTEGPDAGTEVLFVKGKYDDKLLVHMGRHLGFLNLALDPNGFLAMRNNRHSILESHLGHIITLVQSNYEKGAKNKELNASSEGLKLLEGREALAFKAVFPKDKGYYGHIVFVDIDQDLFLPVQVKVYGWDMELLEWYHYSKLEADIGLSEKEFDKNNREYGFVGR